MYLNIIYRCRWILITLAIFVSVNSEERIPSFSLHVASSFNGWLLEINNSSEEQVNKLEVNKLCYETEYLTGMNLTSQDGQEFTFLDGSGNSIQRSSFIQNVLKDEKATFLKCNRTGEGLAMTVLNQRSGLVTYSKILPMWEFWIHWDNLIRHLSYIPAGRIVIFSFSGQGSAGLRYAIPHLVELGSILAPHLSLNSSWIWAFVKSGRTLHESCPLFGQPFINVSFPLEVDSEYNFPTDEKERSLMRFCDENELMGSLCDGGDNFKVSHKIKPPFEIEHQNLKNVPVIITAGSRLWYFSYTLRKLLSTPGVRKKNIVAVIGGQHQSFITLANLLGIKYKIIKMVGENNARLFQYYRMAYDFVNNTYSNSPAVIFLDEDVEVSPDFFNFFNQTLPLLKQDTSLYCINAFSTARSNRLFSDPAKVFRGTAQVAWGYAVSLQFVRDALEIWPTNSSYEILFDQFLMQSVGEDKECIFPDQTRTIHFGSEGMNTKATFDFEMYVQKLPIVGTYGHQITNINDMPNPSYEKYLQRDIRSATILEGNPCSPDFIPENAIGSLVFYYLFSGWTDKLHFNNFMISGLCLGFWSVSSQAFHNGVTSFGIRNNSVIHMVGVPWSPFAYLTPMDQAVWDAFIYTNEERKMMIKNKDDWEEEERKKVMKKDSRKNSELSLKSLFCEK